MPRDLKRRALPVSFSIRARYLSLTLSLALLFCQGAALATPAEAEKLRERARIAMEQKSFKEAVELLEHAHQADPSKPGILKDLAVALAADGRIGDATTRYKEYLKEVPGDEEVFLAMATTLSWSKEQPQRDEAEKLFTEYLAKHPDADEVVLRRARVRAWSGKIDAAEKDFLAYIAKHNEGRIKLELAQALSSTKDPAALNRAIAIYDAYLIANPDNAILLQRARVHSWANHTAEAAADYRAYLKTKPDDETATIELSRALAWSKRTEDQREAIVLLDKRLTAHPDDYEALLARARAYAWTEQHALAVRDFRNYLRAHSGDDVQLELARALNKTGRPEDKTEAQALIDAYIAKHPNDDKVALELAGSLSAAKDKPTLLRALAIYDEHLKKHPEDSAALLQRARIRTWVGQTKEAAEDFNAYGAMNPGDDSYLLELANALSQSPSPADAIPVYEQFLAKHPEHFSARARRARALLWIGDYVRAESALVGLQAEAKTDAERTDVEIDLSQLYAQTGRRYNAIDLLDEILAREPTNEAALRARERVALYLGSTVTPKLFFFQDKAGIRIFSFTVEGRAALTKRLSIVLDVGGYSLGTLQETILAMRANAGAWTRYKFLELEAALGPRFYELFSPNIGGRAWAKVSPTAWASALLNYQYDDIYYDMLQPASVAAGIRGHALHLTTDVVLPYRVRVVGRVGSRALLPNNQSLEATGTIFVPIVGPLSAGYNGQFLTWKDNDPSYWSPTEFVAHLGVLKAAQTFYRLGLGYDVQAVVGIAGERLTEPDVNFGLSFGGSGAVIYSPIPRVELRLTAQYSQTVREVPRLVVGGSAKPDASLSEKVSSKYYWGTGTASALIYF